MNYEMAGQRCPGCGKHFRVLADEAGTHECPYCGYHPEKEVAVTMRCNNCYRLFEDEEDLERMEDEDGAFLGCPDCKTDEYLMDLD